MLRSGFASNDSGSTFFLPGGTRQNQAFTDEFLERHGAVKGSSVIMTPSGYLTDEAWKQIIPKLIMGVRHHV